MTLTIELDENRKIFLYLLKLKQVVTHISLAVCHINFKHNSLKVLRS